ncbi:hypothetical protein L0337_27055 [candidate division KSB1 bacterium]|nr:hypothetical protein [candidate division KSB1 bacterium]
MLPNQRLIASLCLVAFFLLLPHKTTQAQSLDVEKLKGLKPRSIGPAGMSGRVAAIEVDLGNPDIIYVGAATSGVWKSTNGGISWEPIFDKEATSSIGAIAVDPRNAEVIWVGTGEGNPRNSAGVGAGIYKSVDGGRKWMPLGLDKTERIHRVLIHPHNSDIVYVAAMGTAWGENPERGVFKTTDAGKTWQKVLFVDEKTGAADLVMDPRNPDKLIAATWQHRRWPWFLKSGGPGSGIYVTYDGGKTWEKRTAKDGLPKGELGRIGLAIAHNKPDVVYALIEAKKNALYRSDDGGFKWPKVNDSRNVNSRPFYYADIRVDPNNENRIYSLQSQLRVSEDGGKTFRSLISGGMIHGDHHELWIHPQDPTWLINGNDGGVAISRDQGKTWRFVENLPFAQFYHIAVDMETPYNVYGGMQDNGSWRGPSQVWTSRLGIMNFYWARVGSGDGFATLPDLSAPNRYGYAMSQGGNLVRFDLLTGERKFIKPTHPQGIYLRFNWNAGIAHDPFDPRTIYYGSQFLHKSTDRGETWEIISPDLTTNDPEKQQQLDSGGLTYDVTNAENHTTILTIAPSSLERGVIWVGTDDGNVQLTRDGGQTWTNVVKNIKGVPATTWAPHIEASKFNAAEAFVVFDDHRRSNWTPYVFKTNDYGKTWKSLVTNEISGFVHVIEQDPVEPNLLFLGTEFGLYASLDGGQRWTKWTQNFPTVPVLGLVVHPREHDLVVGTHGRGAFIMDDIRPLRVLAKQNLNLLNKPLHVFEAPEAIQYIAKEPNGIRGPGDGEFLGENRPYGALMTYVTNAPVVSNGTDNSNAKADSVTIEILDANRNVIRTMKAEALPGINRTTWELRRKAFRDPDDEPRRPNAPERPGPLVLPGRYTVRLSLGNQKDSTSVTVLPDPRKEATPADMQAKYTLIERVGANLELAAEAIDRLRSTKESIDAVMKKMNDRQDETAKAIQKQSKAMQDSIQTLVEQINQKEVQGIRRDPNPVGARLSSVYFALQTSWDAPAPAEKINLKHAEETLASALGKVNYFYQQVFPGYQKAVDEAGVRLFEAYEPLGVSNSGGDKEF